MMRPHMMDDDEMNGGNEDDKAHDQRMANFESSCEWARVVRQCALEPSYEWSKSNKNLRRVI